MTDNNKKYRRSALSIICYVLALLMLFYIIYTAGTTISQINQYYAQYDMKAQAMEYVTYIMQAILEPLINAVIFFMLGYILNEVRKNNSAYYLSDEEIEEAKIAKREARISKKAAAGEAAAVKAGNIATPEQSVEADFAKSLDEELSKAAEKKAPRQRSGNSQKKSGENRSKQDGQNTQNKKQNDQNKKQNNQNKKKSEGPAENAEKKSGNKKGKDGGKKDSNPEGKKNSDNTGKNNNSGGSRRRNSRKPSADKPKSEAKEASKDTVKEEPVSKAAETFTNEAIESLRAAAKEAEIIE